jgi:hypothetical protein
MFGHLRQRRQGRNSAAPGGRQCAGS